MSGATNSATGYPFDLGAHGMSISTTSEEAQRWFNLGLNWVYGFNHEEAITCFEQALRHDPDCVMAHWGAAYASGPFYNNVWRQMSRAEADHATRFAANHIAAARVKAAGATVLENRLVEALSARVQEPHGVSGAEFDRWDQEYVDALRAVYRDHQDNHDVAALFAEALITKTAWKLWNVRTGEPADGADTLEALAVIEHSIAMNEAAGNSQHPAILHLHIHTVEMSNTPEQAMRSADRLGTLCPDAGHMNHMPGHIYVLCGEYLKAKQASERAIAADNKFVDYAGPFNFYTTARCHDLHLMMYISMLLGQFAPAMAAAEQIAATLTKEVLSVKGRPQLAITLEGYYSMSMHVLVRFGKWREIVAAPMPDDPALYCVSTAMHHYAKGVAHAALGDFAAAEAEQAAFLVARARVPLERRFFNNAAVDILGVGEKLLAGELAYHRGEFDAGFAALREAVWRDDNLEYTEPWAWMHPPRHALGALLAEQGQYAEAEAVFRADLGLDDTLQRCAQHPGNVWALKGLVDCLKARQAEGLPEFEAQFGVALAMTDTPIAAACACASGRG